MAENEQDNIDQDRFSQLMDCFAPFEAAPHIAVGVSGGADSMALAALLSDWVEQKSGRMTALIVDHGLRFESAEEAHDVSKQLRSLGINVVVLPWVSGKVSSGVQEKARIARYNLMEDWCRRAGVLHLAIAHHADDQAETVLMRMQKGSGSDGLSGIPMSRELSHCRIMRPLLSVRKSALLSFLIERGIGWIEDPSNKDPKYARTTVREGIKSADLDVDGIVQSAARYTRVRESAEINAAAWLARYAELRICGYITLDHDALFKAPEDIRLRVLSRVATVIGGKTYAPPITSVERLHEKLQRSKATTLSGSFFQTKGDRIFIYRETRNLPEAQPVTSPSTLWDGRFRIYTEGVDATAEILPFNDLQRIPNSDFTAPKWFSDLPPSARRTIPVIRDRNEILMPAPSGHKKGSVSMAFEPKIPLVGMGFSVA